MPLGHLLQLAPPPHCPWPAPAPSLKPWRTRLSGRSNLTFTGGGLSAGALVFLPLWISRGNWGVFVPGQSAVGLKGKAGVHNTQGEGKRAQMISFG